MSSPDSTRSSVTRRTVLGRTAGAVTGFAGTTATDTPAPVATPTAMTQNAYVGFGIFELLRAESLADVRRIAGEFLDDIDPAVYAARAESLAAAIEAADAAVVGLQEAVTIRRQPSESGGDSEVLVDFLASIQRALADRGLDYTVAAETVTNDTELPAETDDGRVTLHVTDTVALLVRSDLAIEDAVTGTYDATLGVPIPGLADRLVVRRGYAMAHVRADAVGFTAVSTHLEPTVTPIRFQQARGLLDVLPDTGPVVVCADLNSGPGDDTYALLTESLTDPYTELRPDADASTCCHASDLRNSRSQLHRRIDVLLSRGTVEPTSVGRVGHRPSDRTTVTVDGDSVRVWPSDHAGVVGTFDITPAPSGSGVSNASGLGLGALAGVTGLALGVEAWLRRRD